MLKNIIFLSLFITFSFNSFGQKKRPLEGKNVIIVAQQNELADRYSLEVALLQLFNDYQLKTKAALNLVKHGQNPKVLISDSLTTLLKAEGFDTYLLVSVRGYDKKYKQSSALKGMKEEMDAGHLFSLYRDEISNITFTFTFYKDLEPIHSELIRVSSVGSRDVVLKKLMKKVDKRLQKAWL